MDFAWAKGHGSNFLSSSLTTSQLHKKRKRFNVFQVSHFHLFHILFLLTFIFHCFISCLHFKHISIIEFIFHNISLLYPTYINLTKPFTCTSYGQVLSSVFFNWKWRSQSCVCHLSKQNRTIIIFNHTYPYTLLSLLFLK